MLQSTTDAPVNSIVFISDEDGGDAPIPVRGVPIHSTPSCVSVACYPENEGKTEFVLGTIREADQGTMADFDGEVETPRKHLLITTVDDRLILKVKVPTTKTRVRVWRSHPLWPKRVVVAWG